MELDNIIKDLNKKIILLGVGLDKLSERDLTKVEKAFVETYQPGKSIIIYGSLAPDKPNHSKVEQIKGKWQKGTVKGKLANEGWGAELGYFGFKQSYTGEPDSIAAYILYSDELVDNWLYLDEFEGDGYRRILAKFELDNGEVGVGNIYAINDVSG